MNSIEGIINAITKQIVNPLIILLFGLATLMFAYGIIKYIIAASPQKVEEGRKTMLYGILGMFVMASAWGIVSIICNFFGSCTSR